MKNNMFSSVLAHPLRRKQPRFQTSSPVSVQIGASPFTYPCMNSPCCNDPTEHLPWFEGYAYTVVTFPGSPPTNEIFFVLTTVHLRWLTYKVVLLLAIASAQWANELSALWYDLPFLQLCRNKVTIFPWPVFLHKVVSVFQLDQLLSNFLPSPSTDLERVLHIPDIYWALAA